MVESIETSHGTVEYETETCTSCGDEFNEEDMTDVIVGDVTDHYQYKERYKFANGCAHGKLCPYCREEPAGYPIPDATPDELVVIAVAFLMGVVIGSSMLIWLV